MMVPVGDERAPDFVNRLLRTNFDIMNDLGPEVSIRGDARAGMSAALTRQTCARARAPSTLSRPQVLKPFNQDVVQPRGLLAVLAQATLRDPLNIPLLVLALGPVELASWLGHFAAMLAFDAAHHALGPRARRFADELAAQGDAKRAFRLRRLAEQWEYGSGQDYVLTLPGDS